MQPATILARALERCADKNHCLFAAEDFLSLFPDFTIENLRMLLSRSVKRGLLERVCKGIFLYPKVKYDSSMLLFKVAAKIRADCLNYVSLETVLSQVGVISQIPLGWITVMTTGRRGIINCGRFGSIEYIHTEKRMEKIIDGLHLDKETGMLWATPERAFQDMKDARRPLDLIDEDFLSQCGEGEGK